MKGTADLPKVVVLGGGTSALTAAFELSRGDWGTRFKSITVYQQGWRLGGKGASGRNATYGDQIEEHGLHVWFGYYENSFRMLRECHEELERMARRRCLPRWSTTMTDVTEGFRPVSDITVLEDESGDWRSWTASFPEDERSPWDRDLASEPIEWTIPWYCGQLVRRLRTLVPALVESALEPTGGGAFSLEADDPLRIVDTGLAGVASAFRRLDPLLAVAWVAGEAVARGAGARIDAGDDRLLVSIRAAARLLDRVMDTIRARVAPRLGDDTGVRRLWCVADLSLTVLRGLLSERVLDDDALDRLDETDFRRWLDLHGALDITISSSLVRCLAYDLPFAYEHGDRRRPSIGAGTAIRLLLRTFFTYRGAVMWKMNAGMGDVVFAPLFELLVKRGVRFEFFHQVTDVQLDAEARSVERVAFRRQRPGFVTIEPPADLNAAQSDAIRDEWLMGVEVRPGGPMKAGRLFCWPSRPIGDRSPDPQRYEQWPFGEGLTPAADEVSVRIDERDVVVFGLPVGTLEFAAKGLLQSTAWRRASEELRTVATVALQLWLDEGADALGVSDDAIACGFSEPLDTFSMMPALRYQEHDQPPQGTVVYLCSVLSDQPNPTSEARVPQAFPGDGWSDREWRDGAWSEATTIQERFLLDRARHLWPLPFSYQDGGVLAPQLWEAVEHWRGERRPADGGPRRSYLRVNIDPSERYVLSVAGSLEARIDPGDTGIDNLFAAGDWTRCVLNIGCVEAATISGRLAAEAALRRSARAQHRPEDELAIIGRPGPTLLLRERSHR